jgi:hypothetical protein
MRVIKRLDPPLAHVNFLDGSTISLMQVSAIHELNPLLVLMLNEGPYLSPLLRMALKSSATNQETSTTYLIFLSSSQKIVLGLLPVGP